MPRIDHNSPQILQLRRMAQMTAAPLYGAFELTARCNLDCKMCYVHTMDAKEALRTELSTEDWLRLMDAACDQGMLFALLTGGECLLRPDFRQLYLHLQERGVFVYVNTNGTMLTEEIADFFAAYPPDYVQISLYGIGDDGYEAVTGHRAFSRALRAVELLTERKIPTEIAVTVSKYLLPQLEEILTFIRDRKLSYKLNSELTVPRDSSIAADYLLTQEEMLEAARIERRVFGRKPPVAQEDAPRPGCEGCAPAHGLTCIAGTIRFAIDHKGNMLPCLMLADIATPTNDRSFEEAWTATREKTARILRPGDCEGCAYNDRCSKCLVFRVKDLFSGEVDPVQCDYTYQRKKEGLL